MSTNEFEYRIDYSDDFTQGIEGDHSRLILGFKIIANGRDITGAPADQEVYYKKEYMESHLSSLLKILPRVVEGDSFHLSLWNHADVLVFDSDGERLKLGYQRHQAYKDGESPEFEMISVAAFVEEIADTARNFNDKCVELNPEYASKDDMQTLRSRLEMVESEVL